MDKEDLEKLHLDIKAIDFKLTWMLGILAAGQVVSGGEMALRAFNPNPSAIASPPIVHHDRPFYERLD